VVVSGLSTFLLWLIEDPHLAASFGLGALAMGLSTAVMGWTTVRTMQQKTFALTALIIVIKYAVLLGTLYYVSQTEWLRPFALVCGVASFMISALLFAVFERNEKKLG
jgi:uncharacterized membrane protein (GlpM family)